MTKGPLTPHLLAVAWPVSLSFLVQTMYNLVDTFWLGKLGKTALVAPTITLNVVFIGIALAMGLSQAGTTLVSQYKGAGRPNKMGLAAGQSLLLQLVVGVFIAIIGFVFAEPMLRLLHTPADAFDDTLIYMRWILAGLPLMFVFHVYQSILFGLGDTISPMKVNIMAVAVNLVLDPILIFGWGPIPAMGVAGAAIATVLARSMAAGLAMYSLLWGDSFRIRAKDLRWDRTMFWRLLRIGMPLSVGQTATSLGFTLLIGIVNGFGSSVTAAFGVGHRVVMMVAVPAMGLSQANATCVGQNLGAGFPDRALASVRQSALLVGSILFPLTLLMYFYGGSLTQIFINDPEVIAYGRELFRITAFSLFAFSLIMVLFSAFQGAGKTVPVMVVNTIRLWGLRIPVTLALTRWGGMGPEGIWWAMNISNLIAGGIAVIWFLRSDWRQTVIEDDHLPHTQADSQVSSTLK